MVPENKRKRSLHEAFGVVRQPGENGADGPAIEGATEAAEAVGTPEDDRTARAERGKAEKAKPAARKTSRASSNGKARSGETRSRRKKEADSNSEPVNTVNGAKTRSRGRGSTAARTASEAGVQEGEMVPGKGGVKVPAETPVNMTFTVSAKERYLWTLELKRRGLTAVGVLRETMEGMIGDGGGEG